MLLALAIGMFGYANAQKSISGTVLDANGAPVPNASVTVQGSSAGTATDESGQFSLTLPPTAKILVISSIGFQTQEVQISSGNFNVTLTSLGNELENIVVQVPYGTIKKTAFTGAENTVTSETLRKQQVTSVTRALEGVMPGIMATNGGGQPGTGANILIRGVGSVNATSSPLYVLDGVVYDGSIASLSNDDIETVTILKDAAAAALYGSRAANGVVMITTKKGKRGKPAVTLNLRQGIMTRGIPEYDRVNEKQYYEMFWEAYRNRYLSQGQAANTAASNASKNLVSSNGLVYNAYNVNGVDLVDSTTGKLNSGAKLMWHEPWEDALFRQANRTNANVNISGASESSRYYLSSTYLSEDGIMRFTGYKRYNFRLNLDVTPLTWLNAGVNLDGAMAKRKDVIGTGTATSNPFYFTRQMGPIYPVYEHDKTTGAFKDTLGEHILDWGVPAQMGTRPYAGNSNLLGSLALDDRSRDIFNGNSNAYFEIKFLKDFSFKTQLGVNYLTNAMTTYQNNQYGDAAPSTPGGSDGGRSTKANDRQLSITATEFLTWIKSFGDHNFRVLGGHESYKYRYNYLAANASGFQIPGQTELDNGTQSFSPNTSYENNHTIESYFANANYDFDSKYLLSASFRTDGSSRFRKEVRWGNFVSGGLGWVISNEEFLKSIRQINHLKLRASYGELGNDNIGLYYPYREYYYANGNGTYSSPTRSVNTDITWETNSILNIGADFAILNNRITGAFEWYNRQSKNLLFDVPLPPSTGYASQWQNVGTLQNRGVELQLGIAVIKYNDFNWRLDLNVQHFKNKFLKLPALQEKAGIVTGTKKLMVGHSIYDFWLREYAGVDADNGDALYYMDDPDNPGTRKTTKVINNATYYYFGSALPKYSGGITNSFRYKGFDLSILTTFSKGGLFYDGNYASIMHRGSAGTNWSTDILNRWQKAGDKTDVPRVQNAISGQDGVSTRWLIDGSWLNVKNVTLSYTLNRNIASKIKMTGAQFYVNVDNAWLFTKRKGMDPQREFNGTSDASYTPFRTISFGTTLTL